MNLVQADIYSTYSGEVTLKLYKNNNIIFNDKIRCYNR